MGHGEPLAEDQTGKRTGIDMPLQVHPHSRRRRGATRLHPQLGHGDLRHCICPVVIQRHLVSQAPRKYRHRQHRNPQRARPEHRPPCCARASHRLFRLRCMARRRTGWGCQWIPGWQCFAVSFRLIERPGVLDSVSGQNVVMPRDQFSVSGEWRHCVCLRSPRPAHFDPISRIRAVNALPSGSLNVPYSGESTSLFTTNGFWLPVMFSITPRSPKYSP